MTSRHPRSSRHSGTRPLVRQVKHCVITGGNIDLRPDSFGVIASDARSRSNDRFFAPKSRVAGSACSSRQQLHFVREPVPGKVGRFLACYVWTDD